MISNLFKYLPEPDYTAYLPLQFNKVQIGWVHKDHLAIIALFPNIFQPTTTDIAFSPQFIAMDFDARNAEIALFSRYLYDQKIIYNWRDEAYGIYYPNEDLNQALFTIERGVAPFLGFRVFGIHINGYVMPKQNQAIHKMWIAKRSHLKLIEPHKLDNIAAGGLSYGEIPRETAIREAMEEANIPEALTHTLRYEGPFNYLAEYNKTVRNECIFVFDLALPEQFSPMINDGEVEAFYCLSPIEIEEALLNGEQFKPNSGIVTLHFLLRHNLTHFAPQEINYLKTRLAIA